MCFPMRNDNKLECKEVELFARDSQYLLSEVLSDPAHSAERQTFPYLMFLEPANRIDVA